MRIEKMYELVKWIIEDSDLTQEQKLKLTRDIKKDIRKIMKPLNTDPFDPVYHYNDTYFDSYYIKEFFGSTFTEEEKKEFIEDQWRRICSPYDCTGQTFTQRIVICNFKEPNSFGAMSCVYHFLGLDV